MSLSTYVRESMEGEIEHLRLAQETIDKRIQDIRHVLSQDEPPKACCLSAVSLATRTAPGHYLRCQDCQAPHIVDTSMPSHIWNAICENRPGVLPGAAGIGMPEVGMLCTLCIDARLQKAGLTCNEAEFYFVGTNLSSRLYAEQEASSRDVARQARASALGAEGSGFESQRPDQPFASPAPVPEKEP